MLCRHLKLMLGQVPIQESTCQQHAGATQDLSEPSIAFLGYQPWLKHPARDLTGWIFVSRRAVFNLHEMHLHEKRTGVRKQSRKRERHQNEDRKKEKRKEKRKKDRRRE